METSPLICRADWFLYDNGPRHERVKSYTNLRSRIGRLFWYVLM